MPRVKPAPRVSTRLKLENCIFCGVPETPDNPITDEHIWSDWLKKIIPRGSTRVESRVKASTDPDEPERIVDPETALMGDVHTKQAKVVCARCNNGWMNGIVQEAIPVATNVILKKTINLDIPDQKKLATWLALQAMMADLLAKQPIKLPHADLDYLHNNKGPPPELFIGVGTYLGPPFIAFNHNTMPSWSEDDFGNRVKILSVHTLTSIIGALYVIVCRSDPNISSSSPSSTPQPCRNCLSPCRSPVRRRRFR
jgi:hypothetical protein